MKRILTLLFAVTLLMCMAMTVSAAQEEDFVNLEEVQDVVFGVSWDTEKPEIIFISPDGTEYDPDQTYPNTLTAFGENALYFKIENAAAGQWRVRYDKGKNATIQVQVMESAKPLYITEFDVGEVKRNDLPVSFVVEGEGTRSYSYRISAMIDHVGVEKVLATGNGRIGNKVHKTLYLSELASYGSYILKLQVSYQKDDAEIFDFVYSEPFSYSNESLDEKAQDFDLTVAPDTSLLYVSVPDLNRHADGIMVAVFEDNAAEPALFHDFSKDEASNISLSYNPTATEVAVEVAVLYDGVYATPIRKTFKPKDMGISIPQGEAFNHLVLPMTYSGMSKQVVNVSVNGYNTELVLDGSGSVNITLGDDWNTLDITFTASDRITWLLTREIFVDRVPPVLNMSQSYDGMTLEDTKFTISGSVMDYNTVTVNGVAVTPDGTGLFTQELTLVSGANPLEVVATDKLGNQTKYNATIYQGVTAEQWQEAEAKKDSPGGLVEALTKPGNYWVLLIAGIVSLLIIGYALIFWRKEAKK